MKASETGVKVGVYILTRSREAGLKRALDGLAKQELCSGQVDRLRIVVIDNDPERTAEPMCNCLRPTYPWMLAYASEPVPGIPQARNRAIRMAIEVGEALVFLDDDEVPGERWLSELLITRERFAADVVFGPVIPYFPGPVPRWVVRGAFFDRKRLVTGAVCPTGGSGNVLISSDVLGDELNRFDETYRLTGGSDTFFFSSLSLRGYHMVWADSAVATEWVPLSRATVGWLARRHLRNGALLGGRGSFRARAQAAAQGFARIILGTGCAIMLFPFGLHWSVRAIRWVSFGAGLVWGAAGRRIDEYRTIHSV